MIVLAEGLLNGSVIRIDFIKSLASSLTSVEYVKMPLWIFLKRSFSNEDLKGNVPYRRTYSKTPQAQISAGAP